MIVLFPRVGRRFTVLVEQTSKRSAAELVGRADGNFKVIFPKQGVPCAVTGAAAVEPQPGDYVEVRGGRGGADITFLQQTAHHDPIAIALLRRWRRPRRPR